jgi:uncharacterized protein (TIGR02270 family)
MLLAPLPAHTEVLAQHVEDAALLRTQRRILVRAPHVKLLHLGRADERLEASLDALTLNPDLAARLAREALASPGLGEIFVAAAVAVQRRDLAELQRLCALIEPLPHAAPAIVSALAWATPANLRGIVPALLADAAPATRYVGLAACIAHRVDPGPELGKAIDDADPRLQRLGLDGAALLGKVDQLDRCKAHLNESAAPEVQFAAAASMLLLGDRTHAGATLGRIAATAGPLQDRALFLSMWLVDVEGARALIQRLAAMNVPRRLVVKACAWAGDVQSIPWLLQQMADPMLARVAGEAFTALTGVDLADADLDTPPPGVDPSAPDDDPQATQVALDDDADAPWPDVAALTAWWTRHAHRHPVGVRLLGGSPPSEKHCIEMLNTQNQRLRALASLERVRLAPGQTCFNWAAPASRQRLQLQRL